MQNFAAQYDAGKGADPGPGPAVSLFDQRSGNVAYINIRFLLIMLNMNIFFIWQNYELLYVVSEK